MQLTRGADYGVRVMVQLASAEPGARMSLGALAEAAEAPAAFLSKVLQQLVRTGLVVSHRGKRGGFSLANHGTNPSLLEIVDAMDGLPPLNDCLKTTEPCDRSSWCGAHLVWLEAQSRMRDVLAGAKLDTLVHMTRTRRSVAGLN
jgi:Rrf2 family protein